MCKYLPESYERFDWNVKSRLNLPNYSTKTDLIELTDVDIL